MDEVNRTPEDVDLPSDAKETSEATIGSNVTLAPRELSINELEKTEDLLRVARDFDLHLHPARTRHHHILDIARAALGKGATVTAEGVVEQAADSFGLLRYPGLNFLPVPVDVSLAWAA